MKATAKEKGTAILTHIVQFTIQLQSSSQVKTSHLLEFE